MEERIQQALNDSILKAIRSGEAIKFSYDHKLDAGVLVKEAYNKLDKDKLMIAIVDELQREIAKHVVHKIASEISTDIKNLLGNKTIRDDVTYYVRKKLEEGINTVESKK